MEGHDSEEEEAIDELVIGGQIPGQTRVNAIDDELTLAKEIADNNKEILSKNAAQHPTQ